MARLRSIAVLTVIALVLLVVPGCRNPLSDAIQAKIDEYNFEPIRNANLVESQALVLLGGTRQLTLATIPVDATNQNATWTSSDLAVVTASSSGLLTGESCGRATIEMVTEDGGFTDSCEVAVSIIRWHTALGAEKYDVANCIRPTSDGGYIACGYYGYDSTTLVYNRGWIVKLNADGSVQWEVKPNYSRWLQSVRELTDGTFVAAGYGFSTGYTYEGAYLVKVYSNGTVMWEASGPTESNGHPTSPITYAPIREYRDAIPTADGGFLAVGSAYREQWNVDHFDYTYPAAAVPHGASGLPADIAGSFLSSVDNDRLYAIEAYGTDYIAAGGSGTGEFYLLKISAGNPPALVTGFGSGGEMRYATAGELRGLCVDGNAVYCTGISSDANDFTGLPAPILAAHGGIQDVYAAKINASTTGDIEWHTLLGGSGDMDTGFGVCVDPAGGIVITGMSQSELDGGLEAYHTNRDIYVGKLAANGQLAWQTNLGGTGRETGFYIAPAQDGGFVLAGFTRSSDLLELLDEVNDTLAADDFYIAKIY